MQYSRVEAYKCLYVLALEMLVYAMRDSKIGDKAF